MRRPTRPIISGLFPSEGGGSHWIREQGRITWPFPLGAREIIVEGEVAPPAPGDATSGGRLGLSVAGSWGATAAMAAVESGPFVLRLAASSEPGPHEMELRLTGVWWSNVRAWMGRVTGLGRWQPWRRQARNRRLRLLRIRADNEIFIDLTRRDGPWNGALLRRHLRVGLNVLGYHRADLGIGESARCMVRASDAAGIPTALIDLRLPCKNPMADATYLARLGGEFPHPATVVHVDPPGMRDLDHHHGPAFRRDRHVVGYWAWELTEFPDDWIDCASNCDEIWTPSRFTAAAVAEKVPVPVLTMPHAISFPRPEGDHRAKFGLPGGRFLFLFVYDLNSYSERKNPEAAIEAFRRSGLGGRGAALVVKVHNIAGNEADFARLQKAAAAVPDTTLIGTRLNRSDVYELLSACDCFVSLHRSEGFGLAVAESMYLGKPVIATDWSATAEFVSAGNGCPVRARLVPIERDHGPYVRGQVWAEPDVDQAADWMRRLAADPSLAARLGAAGRRTIEEYFSPESVGARYRRRLEAIARW